MLCHDELCTQQKAEKEWELQLKNMELKKKVDELSRKLNLLEKEASGVSCENYQYLKFAFL